MTQSQANPFSTGELYITGTAIGLTDIGMEFDPTAEYCGCRLCGRVYQSKLDRQVKLLIDVLGQVPANYRQLLQEAYDRRQRWRLLHRRRYHSDREVEGFTKSGLMLTPEAAHKLAPLGFTPLGDTAQVESVADAMLKAPRAPTDDVEGS